MNNACIRIAIVGAGLGGLVAALLLRQQGVHDVLLFEARPMVGGRILSVDSDASIVDAAQAAPDRFDLGPTWFWPALQPQLDRLIDELGLQRFAQFEDGDMLVEQSALDAPRRMRGHVSDPRSMRLAGGCGALIAALHNRLDPDSIRTNTRVRQMRRAGARVELQIEDAAGNLTTQEADQVLLAVPPRLAERGIVFDPPLPPELARQWRNSPTWMAPHAKYVAIYDRPFWRDRGLSGSARSQLGPMVEIHDASMPGGHAALFGFLGVPTSVRREVGDAALRTHCRAQLGRLYGGAAANPIADAVKDWAADPLTATDDDQHASGHQTAAPACSAGDGPWRDRLIGVSSEWSTQFPGYLAGAVDAATRGVNQCLTARPTA